MPIKLIKKRRWKTLPEMREFLKANVSTKRGVVPKKVKRNKRAQIQEDALIN